MEILPAAEVLAISYPVLDALQAFWRRLIQVQPEARDLVEQRPAKIEHAEALRRLIAEILENDELLRRQGLIKIAARSWGAAGGHGERERRGRR